MGSKVIEVAVDGHETTPMFATRGASDPVERVASVLCMTRLGIGQCAVCRRAGPCGDDGALAGQVPQYAQRVLLQAHVKQNLGVVEQNGVGTERLHGPSQDVRQPYRARACVKFQKLPGELEVDVDQRRSGSLRELLKHRGLARTSHANHQHQPIVDVGSVGHLPLNLMHPRFKVHWRSDYCGRRVASPGRLGAHAEAQYRTV